MGVAQVAAQQVHEEAAGVYAEQLELDGLPAEEVEEKAGEQAGDEDATQGIGDALEGVDAEEGEGGEDLGGVVDFVELPEGGHGVHEAMEEVAAEVPDDEEDQRIDGGDLPGRPAVVVGDAAPSIQETDGADGEAVGG